MDKRGKRIKRKQRKARRPASSVTGFAYVRSIIYDRWVTRSEKEAALGCDTVSCSSIPYTSQHQFIFADPAPPSYHVPSFGCVANDDNSIQQTCCSYSALAVSHATCVRRCSARRANSRFSGMFFRSSLFILRIWNYSFCSQLSHLASQHHTSEYNKLKFGPGGRCY